MKRPLFPIRAYLALRHIDAAVATGSLDRVSLICRQYLANRLPHTTLPLRGADAHVAFWAAFAAMCFEDEGEVQAVLEMLQPRTKKTKRDSLFGMVELFSAALQGDLDAFAKAQKKNETPYVAFARVVAIEHAYDKLTPELVSQLRPHIKPEEFSSPGLRSRAALVSAIFALCDGEPDKAVQTFVELQHADSPMMVVLSAMARGDFKAVRAEWPELSSEEQTTALHYGAFLLGSAKSTQLHALLETLEGKAKGAPREALVAMRVIKMAREGECKTATELGADELQKSSGESPVLACATASAALMHGNASAALKALRKATPDDAMAVALHWMALAIAGNDVQLAREIVGDASSPPADYTAPLSTVILAALARSGAPFEDKLPAWLKPADTDAKGLYALGLVHLHRLAAEDAVAAFERALKIEPTLTTLGDAPDVARVLAAKNYFIAGNSKAAGKMLAAVKSARLEPLAERLELLTVLRESAKDRKSPLDERGLAALVDKLASGAAHSKAIAALRADLVCRRVRILLRDGNVVEARAARKDLLAIDSPDAVFLLAAIDACDDHVPLAETAKKLEAAHAKTTHAGIAVLHAEITAILQGSESGISALEASATNTSGRLVGHALTDAYRRAHRGIDAKRAWFVGLNKASKDAPMEYTREIREILEVEMPPFSARGQKVTRKTREAFLSFEGLLDRVPMLLLRTKSAITREPKLREALESEIEKLKAGLKAKEASSALKAELEIVRMAGGTWA